MKKNNYFLIPFIIGILIETIHCYAGSPVQNTHLYNGIYEGKNLSYLAFPIGGIGSGMFCLEGTGYISHMAVRNHPDMFNEPGIFAALHVNGIEHGTKIIEGPVPDWRKFNTRGGEFAGSAFGCPGRTYGLPRFSKVSCLVRFPFCTVSLKDNDIPVDVEISGWSPFIPTDADNSSLPAGFIEYTFRNTSDKTLETIFSFNSRNFMKMEDKGMNRIKPINNGFILSQSGTKEEPFLQGDFAIFTDQPNTAVDYCWFRGGWWDDLTMAWNAVKKGELKEVKPVSANAPGASLYVPVKLTPGEVKTIKVYMAWYSPKTNLRTGEDPKNPNDNRADIKYDPDPSSKYYEPWYTSKFNSIEDIAEYLIK